MKTPSRLHLPRGVGLGIFFALTIFKGAHSDEFVDDLVSEKNVSDVCNMTAWHKYLQRTYSDERTRDLRTSSLGNQKDVFFAFWGVRDIFFSDDAYTMTNEYAMERSAEYCKLAIHDLTVDRSGAQGPIEDYWLYNAMCSDFCIESDLLHLEALELSACTCLEVSTPMTADICLKNSAAILCAEYGHCGVWKCPIDDFMCPRYEYNTKSVKFRGPGNCLSGATSLYSASVPLVFFFAALSAGWLLLL